MPKPVTVYLLHFSSPFHHARHYVGATTNLARRLREHERGYHSHLMAAVVAAGVPWVLARVWTGSSWELERAIKDSHHTSRYCPLCNPRLAPERYPKKILDLMRWRIPPSLACSILPDSTGQRLSPTRGGLEISPLLPRMGEAEIFSFLYL